MLIFLAAIEQEGMRMGYEEAEPPLIWVDGLHSPALSFASSF